MSNQLGSWVKLHDAAGPISNGSQGTVAGVLITAALTGTLTITGVTQSSGAAQSWVIPSTSIGSIAVPGNKTFFGPLNYALSNVGADADLAFVLTNP